MQKKQIDEFEQFQPGTYGAEALENWQKARAMREIDGETDCTDIIKTYALSCEGFIKHIIDHSKGLVDLMMNIDWVKYVTNDASNVVGNQQDTRVMRVLLAFSMGVDKIPKQSYKQFCNSMPYEFVGGLYNCIDELLFHLYGRAKETDKKYYD